MKKNRLFADGALVALFLAAIFCPLADQIFFHFSSTLDTTENRTLAPKPSLDLKNLQSLKSFPAAYEAYFNDNFGFRNLLVRWGSRFKLHVLKISPTPLVIVGKNGWYYYHGERNFDGAPIEIYRGTTSYSRKELLSIKRKIEKQRAWLESLGIQYIILIAPDKPTIYPEYMPDTIRVVNHRSRTDQIYDYLKQSHSSMRIIDMRDELRRAKNSYQVYYKTDHHWNRVGGFLAAQAIVREMAPNFPGLEPFTLDNYEVTVEKQTSDTDLAKMMSMPRELDDSEVMFRLKPKTLKDPSAYHRPLPRILIFHESFFNAVMPFMNDHFASIKETRWGGFAALDYSLIERLRPNVVILEVEESYQGIFL